MHARRGSVALSSFFFLLFALSALAGGAHAQYPANMLGGLHWRDVGPMRGGRTYGVAGNASQPDTFYMGSVGGGVWKTENAGRTWFPISDEGIPIGSIGAIAVAPSNANVVYVGTGEPDIRSQHSYGIGMFKSTDAGKTWTHIGLEDTLQIGKIVVDPDQSESRLRRRAGPCVRGQPRPRPLSLDRWRRAPGRRSCSSAEDPNNVGAIDLAHRSEEPEDSLRLAVGHAPSAMVGLRALQHARRRPVQVHRRRRHLEAARRRSARRMTSSARSASPSRPAIRSACGRWWTTLGAAIAPRVPAAGGAPAHGRAEAPGGVYSPTMPARPGSW